MSGEGDRFTMALVVVCRIGRGRALRRLRRQVWICQKVVIVLHACMQGCLILLDTESAEN